MQKLFLTILLAWNSDWCPQIRSESSLWGIRMAWFFFENPRSILSHEILIHTYPSWLIDSIFGAWCISTCLDGLQRRVAFPETCLHCYLICVGDGICRCREFGSISSICQYSDRECNLVGTSCCRSPIQQTHLLLGGNLLKSCRCALLPLCCRCLYGCSKLGW